MLEDINLLNPYLKSRFGKKLYKLSINGGMTCPNRDGSIDTRGCIFCSKGGSGDFASDGSLSIKDQIIQAKELIEGKVPKAEDYGYIAYFQAFTNTYASVEYLEKIYTEAISQEKIEAISIATRPDCLEDDKIELLKRLNKIKPVFVELGFQTSDEDIALYIRRGYKNNVFNEAVKKLNEAGVEIIVHLIIGLPGSRLPMEKAFLNSVDYINGLPVNGVKFQLLHILKDTDLAKNYEEGRFKALEMEEYINMLFLGIENLRRDIVIHRMTGDGPKRILIAPLWSGNKKLVLNRINKRINDEDIKQGKYYKDKQEIN